MKHRYIIGNNDLAIITKEDGTLALLLSPTMLEDSQDRDSIETGSSSGKKTFRPGDGITLSLRLLSSGPSHIHTKLSQDTFDKIEEVLEECCLTARKMVGMLLDEALLPQQKEELSADEPASEGHTE